MEYLCITVLGGVSTFCGRSIDPWSDASATSWLKATDAKRPWCALCQVNLDRLLESGAPLEVDEYGCLRRTDQKKLRQNPLAASRR